MPEVREIAAIAVVVGLALLGMLPGLRRLRSALGLEHFVSSGHLFLVLGVALGPVGVGLLDDATLAAAFDLDRSLSHTGDGVDQLARVTADWMRSRT